mgnify:CR=1 FL=1
MKIHYLGIRHHGPGSSRNLVEALKKIGAKGDSPQVSLVAARAHAGLGQPAEAEAAFRSAIDRFAGLEAAGRHVAWLAQSGRKAEAEAGMADLSRRYKKGPGPMKGEARVWLGLAEEAIKAAAQAVAHARFAL